MHTPLSRRAWFARAALASVAAAASSQLSFTRAAESLPRKNPARMKLSLAAYSFRNYFKNSEHKQDGNASAGKQMDLFDFIDFCAEHRCDAAELTSYYFPPDTNREFLLKLKRHAFLRGLQISGRAIGNTYTNPPGAERDKQLALTKKWVDYCEILGAPHLRVFAGALPKGVSQEQGVANCIETLREACQYAAEHGVFLGIENHGGIVAEPEPLLQIIKAVDSPWLGINLDSANFHAADPYADFGKCAPFAVNVQIKTETFPKGQPKERADLKRYIQLLREANYQGYVALEFEENADPFKTVPGVLQELHRLIHV